MTDENNTTQHNATENNATPNNATPNNATPNNATENRADEHKELNNMNNDKKPWGMEVKVFCMLLHLSQLVGFVLPGAGLILPIVMWATNKDEHPAVNLHGLIVLNWMLSAFIYFIGCIILMIVLIGVPLMFILMLVAVVFAIIGGIKANEGQYWPYPLSIDFFGVKAKIAAINQQ